MYHGKVVRAGSRYVLGGEELTLFLEYLCLPAHQQGVILVAMAGLNETILNTARDFQWRRRDLDLRPELHITSARTGESIRFKFRQGKIIPSFEFPEDDLVVVLPRWSVALFLGAATLIGGAEVLKSWDEVQQHFPKYTQEQVLNYFDLEQLTDPTSQAGRDIRRHLATFNHEIDSPNILSVRVSDVTIRKREEKEEDGSDRARQVRS